MDDNKLKPCPFCGGEASECAPIGTILMVECRNCMAMCMLVRWNDRRAA